MPKVHSYLFIKLLLLVSIQFQNKNNVSSFPFLHSTCSLSSLYIYLDFENGFSNDFRQNYSCIILLKKFKIWKIIGLSPNYCLRISLNTFLILLIKFMVFSLFARRYQKNLFWFLFLQLLRCFNSLRNILILMIRFSFEELISHSLKTKNYFS